MMVSCLTISSELKSRSPSVDEEPPDFFMLGKMGLGGGSLNTACLSASGSSF